MHRYSVNIIAARSKMSESAKPAYVCTCPAFSSSFMASFYLDSSITLETGDACSLAARVQRGVGGDFKTCQLSNPLGGKL